MTATLKYGRTSSVTLDLTPETLVAECGRPVAQPLDDAAAAVAAALVEPLDFPPLKQAVVPGDRVTIALEPGLPHPADLVAGVVGTLREAEVESEDITILWTREDADKRATDPRSSLSDDVASKVHVAEHDAEDKDAFGYLAAMADGTPIYLNHDLLNADVIVPIGCLRVEGAVGYHGVFGGLYPTFADKEARLRFQGGYISDGRRQKLQTEVDEAGWLLGVPMLIQVVPGAGDSILHVLAGSVPAVTQQGRQLCGTAWNYPLPRRASLVVAGIEGDASCQTWENLARAVSAAMAAVEDGGAIALCTELEERPGGALKSLAGAEDFETAWRAVRKQKSGDAAAASQLLHALDRNRVYLLSRLDESVVEEMGIAPVSGGEDIARLSSRFDSCIVLSNAQYTVPTLDND